MAVIIGDLKLGNLWRSHSEIFRLLVSHANRYPKMGIQDAYKMLYQGAMGSEHIVNSFEEFENELLEEWEIIEGNTEIPLWENIRPDGQIVRVYLSPYKVRDGKFANLTTLCYWSSTLITASKDNLKLSWETLLKTCREKKWNKFTPDAIEDFDLWLKKYDYPPVHHTEQYRKAYNPAYRLLAREFLSVLIADEKK